MTKPRAIRPCSVDGCETNARNKYCSKHWYRLRKHGSFELPKRTYPETCTYEGCSGKFYCRDLCQLHYNRQRQNKKMDAPVARPVRICSRDDCSEKHYAKGLCKTHYSASRGTYVQRPRTQSSRPTKGIPATWDTIEGETPYVPLYSLSPAEGRKRTANQNSAFKGSARQIYKQHSGPE